MHQRSTTRTAAMLLAATVVVAGCGARTTGPAGTPDTSTETELTAAVTSTSTSVVDHNSGGGLSATGSPATTTTTPATETTTVAAVPDVAIDGIDSMLDDLDDTLAGLDQLLNQAAAAMAAEEGEIIP